MPIRFATYNVRNGDADDGPDSWPHRQDALIQMIQQLDADVLGLQEVMAYQLQFILRGLPEYASVGVGRLDGKEEGEFAPILYRKDRFKAVEYGWFWLSETPETPGSKSWDTACERICSWTALQSTNLRIRVFNTHLDHVSEEAQLKGAQLIVARAGLEPAIVMGDFNALPGSPPLQALQGAGFQDSGEGIQTSTFHDWGKVEYGRIDYILSRGFPVGPSQVVQGRVNGRYPSDHHPVVATAAAAT